MVTSGSNDGNEDGTKNAFYTSSRYRTTELLLEDTDNWNITSRSPDAYSYVHGSLKGRSNSKCIYEAMARELSPVPAEDDPNMSLSISFLQTVDVRVKTGEDDSDISLSITFLNEISESSSPVFTRTSTVSRKVMDNEISESSSPVITRTSTVSRKAMVKEISGYSFLTVLMKHVFAPCIFWNMSSFN
jgi:hypothetical protein